MSACPNLPAADLKIVKTAGTFMFEVMIIKRDQMGMASVRRQRNRRNARMGKGSQVAKYRGERALFLLLAAGAAAA